MDFRARSVKAQPPAKIWRYYGASVTNYRKRWPHHTELNKSKFRRPIRVNDASMAPLWVGAAHIAAFTFNLTDLPCV